MRTERPCRALGRAALKDPAGLAHVPVLLPSIDNVISPRALTQDEMDISQRRQPQTVPGALLIVNDVDSDADDELNRWYQEEHLPNRLAIPGFRRVRRFRAIDGRPTYVALYECDSVEVLSSNEYRDKVANPTASTRRILPRFRNVLRAACRQTLSIGGGIGGAAIVVQCKPMAGRNEVARRYLEHEFGPRMLREGALVKLSLLETDTAVTGMPSWELTLRDDQENYPHWVLLIETYDLDKAALALHATSLEAEVAKTALLFGTWARYQLICAVSAQDVGA